MYSEILILNQYIDKIKIVNNMLLYIFLCYQINEWFISACVKVIRKNKIERYLTFSKTF